MNHKCATCGRSDVRLYRSYGMFLRDSDIVCNEHLPVYPSARRARRHEARFMTRGRRGSVRVPPKPEAPARTDWRVPLIEAKDGSVWGYTSCPDVDIERWKALPDSVDSPVWLMPGSQWNTDPRP